MPPPAASPSGGVEETSTTSPAAAATTALADPASQPALHPRQSQRLLRIGVVSDIQYADIPDGKSYHGVPRYYRNSLAALSSVVIPEWASPEVAVDLAMHFGDILDGFQPKDRSLEVLGHVLDQFKALGR